MVKYKVLKPFSTKQENRQFYPDANGEPIELTIKRAEEIESAIAKLDGYENYGPVLERIEEPKEEAKVIKPEHKSPAKAETVKSESAEK